MTAPDEPDDFHDDPAARDQARALREQARKGGLWFEAYVPPALADWLLGEIERGRFADPSEAAFLTLDQDRDLQPYRDLRDELLRRMLQASAEDTRPAVPHEQVMDQLIGRYFGRHSRPARWQRHDRAAVVAMIERELRATARAELPEGADPKDWVREALDWMEPDQHGWTGPLPPARWMPRALVVWFHALSGGAEDRMIGKDDPELSLASWPEIERAAKAFMAASFPGLAHSGNGSPAHPAFSR